MKSDEVILVHGLWFGAWAMRPLARRFERAGFAPRRFRYRTTRGSISEHAARLRAFAGTGSGARLHIVAHSMGGLVALRMLADDDDLPSGRVLLLGSPLRGSTVARKASRLWGIRRLMGRARADLEAGYTALPADRQTGMIAGSTNFGLGYFVGGIGEPSDGTVAIAETRVEGLADHLVLPVTHTGMLFSRAVAEMGLRFLHSGRFVAAP